ncbi:MAG: hypothetical protein J0L84_08305 [Verrucomicrobia bacterium]|nr:hypothetical protein [Verrucomicrobiota bacterium]
MTKPMSWIVLCFGLVELSMVIALHRTGHGLAGWTYPAALVAGGVLSACGLQGLRGRASRTGPVATVSLLALLMLVETVRAWLNSDLASGDAAFAALLSTVLLVLLVGLLMYLLHGDRDAAFYRIPPAGDRGDGTVAGHPAPPAAPTRNRRMIG